MEQTEIQAVVRRVLDGEGEAFSRVYDAYARRVYNFCARTLGSREAGEDAAMETFLKAFRALESYNPLLPFENWLFRIATNHCWDVLRARSSHELRTEPFEDNAPELAETAESLTDRLLRAEEGSEVAAALNSLPAKYRVPLLLRYYNEMSYDEIAQALKMNRATVATMLFRGKEELRRIIQKVGRKP